MDTQTIAKGDIVKPIDTFDFDNYVGPADADDLGMVLDIIPCKEGEGTLLIVGWRMSGSISDHISEDHTGHPDDVLAEFGVVADGRNIDQWIDDQETVPEEA